MQGPQKLAVRQEVLERRDALTEQEHRDRSRGVLENLRKLDAFRGPDTILLFASFGTEVDTWPLLEELTESAKSLVLPAVGDQSGVLHLRVVEDLQSDLEDGVWGIREPSEGCPEVDVGELDFLCIPGVAFDESGGRIGYGGGYYDRLLSQAAQITPQAALVAIAFELQIIPVVPTDPHDRRVPVIVTEERVINCRGEESAS